MADGYWRYGDGRQPAMAPPAGKRPRSDFDGPGVHEMQGYFPREESGGPRVVRDTQSIGASYDQYLQSGQIISHGPADSGRPVARGAGISGGYPADGPRVMGGGVMDPGMGGVGRNMGYGGGRQEPPLPPDATNTLFVEGLPANCTRREVSHIFRPFVGYKEVRLVTKESRHPGGVPLVLCFVDFESASHAAVALEVLQGENYVLVYCIVSYKVKITHVYFHYVVEKFSLDLFGKGVLALDALFVSALHPVSVIYSCPMRGYSLLVQAESDEVISISKFFLINWWRMNGSSRHEKPIPE